MGFASPGRFGGRKNRNVVGRLRPDLLLDQETRFDEEEFRSGLVYFAMLLKRGFVREFC
ncbi:hypothetical protein D3C85_1854120 [compost metagenome]